MYMGTLFNDIGQTPSVLARKQIVSNAITSSGLVPTNIDPNFLMSPFQVKTSDMPLPNCYVKCKKNISKLESSVRRPY